MTLVPLMRSDWKIQLHVAALALAWLVGTWQFFIVRKGSAAHAVLGRIFIALMLTAALSTLFIHERSPDSPFFGLSLLHLYVPLVLLLCALVVIGARAKKLVLHRFAVISVYFGSLLFPGLIQIFLAPGITHQIFFSKR